MQTKPPGITEHGRKPLLAEPRKPYAKVLELPLFKSGIPHDAAGLRPEKVVGGLDQCAHFLLNAGFMAELIDEVIAQHVAFVPDAPFYANEPERNTLRLSFVTVPQERIRTWVEILGKLIASKL
jgi:hypothetical protein